MKSLNLTIALLVFLQASMAFAAQNKSEAVSFNLDKLQYEVESGILSSEAEIKAAATNMVADLTAQGLSSDDIVEGVRDSILNGEQKADFDRLMTSLKTQNASKSETLAQVSKFFSNTQPEGSSYRSTVIFVGVPTGLIVLGVVAYVLLVALANADCSNRHYYDDCTTVVVY